jgi:hypothetical protein
MLIIGIGGTLAMGASSGGAMEPFQDMAGAASAVAGFLRFAFAAGMGVLMIPKTITSSLPLALSAIILNSIGLLLFCYYRHSLKSSD